MDAPGLQISPSETLVSLGGEEQCVRLAMELLYLQEGYQEEVILAGLCIEAPEYPMVLCPTVMDSRPGCRH